MNLEDVMLMEMNQYEGNKLYQVRSQIHGCQGLGKGKNRELLINE